jgi:hypothetical protein
MKLMGDANWWIPGWLDRLLPSVDIEGPAGLPAPEMEPPSRSRRRPGTGARLAGVPAWRRGQDAKSAVRCLECRR